MGRTIIGQVIAGTGIDRHGERLSREELTRLFESWPEDLPAGVNHDLSQLPVCLSFNKRLEEQPSGELDLKVDVEVLDEARFAEFGGFSISFIRQRVRIGLGDPACEVSINPRQLDFEDLVSEVRRTSGSDICIDVVERVEKADVLLTAIVSIAVFVGLQTFSGFFNAIGAHVFELIRKRRRKDEPNSPIQVQYHVHLSPTRRVPVIILVVDADCRTSDIRLVDGERLLRSVETQFGTLPIQRVTGRIRAGGVVELRHVTAADGTVIYRSNDA
jgi:hypothetical protein